MKKTYYLLLVLSLVISSVSAQCTVKISGNSLVCKESNERYVAYTTGPGIDLLASNTAGNNHRGNMFDIVATNSVDIISFEASPMGNTTIEIYYKVGTWNGFANTPSAWTFIGSAPVNYTGGFAPVNVPVNVNIPAGQTYAFYVTSNSTSVALNYSNGTNVGNIYSSDANIAFLEGGGVEYPFTQGTGAVYQPRVWNGKINYALADVPKTFIWNINATTDTIYSTISSPTQFTVESTIAGCPLLKDTINVDVSIPNVSGGTNQVICLGDSVLLKGSGAETYLWDNNITDDSFFRPLLSGNSVFTVIGTDSIGCNDTASVDIMVNALPIVSGGGDKIVCEGNNITLSATGADSYVWSGNVVNDEAFKPTATTSYSVIGTDINGCVGFDTINVNVISTQVAIVSKMGVMLIANAANSYQWINCDSGESLLGETIQIFTAKENGNYAVIIENEYGCIDTSACFNINSVGVDDINNVEVTIYPNPSNGLFSINTNAMLENSTVEVLTSLGQMVSSNIFSGDNIMINIANYPSGIYFVKIQSGKNVHVEKIIKY